MKTAILASGLILVTLADCHQSASQQNSTVPAATNANDYLQRIKELPQKQRDLTFFRAIAGDSNLGSPGVGPNCGRHIESERIGY